MKLRPFVCGSSALLVGWLAVTFMYDIPAQRYQRPDKSTATVHATPEKTGVAASSKEPADHALSSSH